MPTIHSPRPAFLLADAVAIARELFGIAGETTELPGERDLNFHIADRGENFVLKIAHAGESGANIELQHAALAYLARREPGLALQRVVPALDGAELVEIQTPSGGRHWVRLLTFLPGRLWSELAAPTRRRGSLLESLGATLGAIDRGLAGFAPAAARRELKWDLRQAGWIRAYLGHIDSAPRRELVERWLADFDARVRPALERLRQGVIYNDANDHNVVVASPSDRRGALSPPVVAGVIDFGDLCWSNVVCEPAIAAAYAAMGLCDPVAGIARLLTGYHAELPLEPAELEIFHALVCLRLCVSVTNSAYQRAVEPGNTYLTISERPAWELLEALSAVAPQRALYTYRAACGMAAHPDSPRVVAWLERHRADIAPLFASDLAAGLDQVPLIYADWSAGSPELGSPAEREDVAAWTERVFARIRAAGAVAAIGGYDEARPVYASAAYRHRGDERDEWRTVHLGLDLFLPAGTPVCAPLDGVVHSFADNAAPFDYGPCIVLEHRVEDDQGPLRFHTLYGHLSRESLVGLVAGAVVRKGEPFATLGDFPVNGNWPPHLHLQLVLDMLGASGDFIGSCRPSERPLWLSLCPDPNLVARLPLNLFPPRRPGSEALLAERRRLLGANLSLSYRAPLEIVRGHGAWLWDADGQRYLDAYNNVPHVGHSHPKVVQAVVSQLALLNTNTRYLHPTILEYARRLTAKFPPALSVCYFTASGSEANELALRLARAATGHRDMLVMAGAYHGHTTTLIDLSPYKHDGPGGEGRPDWVHLTPVPDTYRGEFRAGDPTDSYAGPRYAGRVAEVIAAAQASGRRLAAYLAETLPSVGGQIVPPAGFYPAVYAAVRASGGLCIADEVQTGFGRTGDTFWAFERYAVVPDIVVLGKPIANGFPMGAVVTTPEIAAAFANGMEFFSTFGGSTAACAAALATLDVVEEEGLQASARTVGHHLLAGLRDLQQRHGLIGDVRGAGLFVGVELVRDRTTLAPAGNAAGEIADRMRDRGVLLGTDGPHHNVLKIRPPLCFTAADADLLLAALDGALAEVAADL
ncbi:MAG: aminotransferase class III-fold pyridoxal phosphate-dependent enzyme [Thermoanaerobaculia bacterium]